MLMITSLIFGVLLAANGCPLDPINCTIPYDDQLNISSDVIIDATQYCHVDNCTVKIIKTGDELNITYHDDQYHLGCTTTTLYLLEVNDNISSSYCEQQEDSNHDLALIFADSGLILIAFSSNVLILIALIRRKKYTTLPFRLLLISTILWMGMHIAYITNLLTRYMIQAPNEVCIMALIALGAFLNGANFIETQIVVTIFYTFYRCYKLYSVLSEKDAQKLFCRAIVLAVCVIFTFSISRALIIVLQETSFVTSSGHCIGVPGMFGVTPITQYISLTLFSCTVIVQITFSVCSAILLRTLSKNNNSSQTNDSRKCLLKIAVIMSSVSLASGVFYTAALYLVGEYSSVIGTIMGIFERFIIFWMLLNKDDVKSFCKCKLCI